MNITCPKCGITKDCPDNYSGKRILCPACGLQIMAMPSALVSFPAMPTPIPVMVAASLNRTLLDIQTDVIAEIFRGLKWMRILVAVLFAGATLGLWIGCYNKSKQARDTTYAKGLQGVYIDLDKIANDSQIHEKVQKTHDEGCREIHGLPSRMLNIAPRIVMNFPRAVKNNMPDNLQHGAKVRGGIKKSVEEVLESSKCFPVEALANDITTLLDKEALDVIRKHRNALLREIWKINFLFIVSGVGLQFAVFLLCLQAWIAMRFAGNYMVEHIMLLREISSNTKRQPPASTTP